MKPKVSGLSGSVKAEEFLDELKYCHALVRVLYEN
jgi:hypothetical protein